MRTSDFESAVLGLSADIAIDEVVIGSGTGGQVKSVYGHSSHQWMKWDEFGRGFSCPSEKELQTEEVLDPRNEVEIWSRNAVYDLKFE